MEATKRLICQAPKLKFIFSKCSGLPSPPLPFGAFSRLCVALCLGELFEPDSRVFTLLAVPLVISIVTRAQKSDGYGFCGLLWGNTKPWGGHVSQIMHVRTPSFVAMQIRATGHLSPAND